jgi:hypothetical protein
MVSVARSLDDPSQEAYDFIMPAGPALGGFCFTSRHVYRAEAAVLQFEWSLAVGVACPG